MVARVSRIRAQNPLAEKRGSMWAVAPLSKQDIATPMLWTWKSGNPVYPASPGSSGTNSCR